LSAAERRPEGPFGFFGGVRSSQPEKLPAREAPSQRSFQPELFGEPPSKRGVHVGLVPVELSILEDGRPSAESLQIVF